MLLANFNGKEHLRHRAVSLRQHGFLVADGVIVGVTNGDISGFINPLSVLRNTISSHGGDPRGLEDTTPHYMNKRITKPLYCISNLPEFPPCFVTYFHNFELRDREFDKWWTILVVICLSPFKVHKILSADYQDWLIDWAGFNVSTNTV